MMYHFNTIESITWMILRPNSCYRLTIYRKDIDAGVLFFSYHKWQESLVLDSTKWSPSSWHIPYFFPSQLLYVLNAYPQTHVQRGWRYVSNHWSPTSNIHTSRCESRALCSSFRYLIDKTNEWQMICNFY